jgi:signal transduction histidine kinase
MEPVREEERARLAREIHDQVGGSLSILKLDVASLHNRIKHDKTLQDKTNDILKEIDGAILTVQQIAMELRPSLLDHHGLAATIEWFLDTNCRRTELDCEKDIDPNIEIKGDHAVALFRILQAAFTNIIRHAKATKITVHLKQDETGIRLVVTDNGVGLEQGQILKPDALGLIGMRERIRPFGGTVTLAGRPGEGTTVTTVIPISSASPSILIANLLPPCY